MGIGGCGIDIGTSTVHACVHVDGTPEMVVRSDGAAFTPAVVAFEASGPRAGAAALSFAAIHPDLVVRSPLRLLGGYRDGAARCVARGELLVERPNGGSAVLCGGVPHEPADILAILLGHVADRAGAQFGERPSGVVVSVPPWLGPDAEDAILRAAELAGLSALLTISCAEAAALGLHDRSARTVAIVDVGAAGVVASIVRIAPATVALLASSAVSHDGGDDVDEALARLVLADLGPRGLAVARSPAIREMLRETVERVKRDLAGRRRDASIVEHLHAGGAPMEVALSGERLEAAVAATCDRVGEACAEILAGAGAGGEIARVYLAGGMTHVPAVRARIGAVFGSAVATARLEDGAAAVGAALLAASILGDVPEIHIEDARRTAPPPPASVHPGATGGERHAPPPPAPAHPPVIEAPPRPSVGVRAIPPPPPSSPPGAMASSPPPESVRPSSPSDAPGRISRSSVPGSRPSGAPSSTIPVAARRPLFERVPAGTFRRPATAAALLAIPCVRPLTPDDLASPSLAVVLLRVLSDKRVTGTFTFEHTGASASFHLEEGRVLLGSREHTHLVDAFTWSEGAYRYEPSPPPAAEQAPHTGPKPATLLKVTVEGLRALIRTFDAHDIEEAFGERYALAPVPRADHEAVLGRLGLTSLEARTLENGFNGEASAKDLVNANSMGRQTTMGLLVLLTVFDCLEWRPVTAAAFATPEERAAARLAKMETQNHFGVMELHWSVLPAEIEARYRSLVVELAPGPGASPSVKASLAGMRRLVDAAYAVLSDPVRRKVYRAQTYDIDFDAVSDLASQRADSLAMRIDHGDMEESRGVARELGRARARALVSAPVVPDGDATGPPSVKPKPPGGPARE